jgi:DNA-binding NarL/FixJ family response regulator
VNRHLIRVLVADDHAVARVGMTTIINAQRDMKVLAVAANGSETVTLYRRHIPDVALLDIRMPVMSGLEAALAIRVEFPEAKIIALTSYGGDEDIRRAVAAGIKSYLTKDTPPKELLTAIRTVHAGEAYILPALAPFILEPATRPCLTSRELQVLELIVRGLVNKQIAYSLNVAEYTVANHVKSILQKMGVQDRTQAATEAIRRGIIHVS